MNIISKEILENSIIVFDTSALIELYYYPEEVLKIIEEHLLGKYKNQFWLANMIWLEYSEKREEKKNVPSDSYNALVSKSGSNGYVYQLESGLEKLSGIFKTLEEHSSKMDKHPHLPNELLENLEKALEDCSKTLNETINPIKSKIEEKIKEYNEKEDGVNSLVNRYFKIGRKFSFKEKFEIAEEGERRYNLNIPPGWADGEGKNAKTGLRKYNDLIIWKQICELSKDNDRDVIFITKDYAKDDWCFRTGKSTYIDNPKAELVEELEEISGKSLRMFSLVQFLSFTARELGFEIETEKFLVSHKVESFVAKEIYAENKSYNCWGVSQTLQGMVYISDNEIRVHVNKLTLENENGVDWYVKSISVNLAYINDNKRWDVLRAGERFNIDADLPEKGYKFDAINIDLIVNREGIEDLNNLWLVFQIDTNNDERKSYGTMYNHWKEL